MKSFFCLRIVLFSVLFSVFSFSFSVAQVKDSVNIGSAKGIIQDSAFNFVLTSATVAIYRDNDSSLLQYSLPNTFGEFSIRSLPVGTALRMVITHIGYKPLTKKFSVSKAKPEYEFGKINLLRKEEGDNELAEIVVTPIRMNGDTLEFNASAFKLDKNATTEDLLRKLPGFTIWSDGEITFNGKKINSVLVEGKPFMGGDFATATQNLPKDAIQKVQVYQQVNQSNLYDSTTNVNLKLKDDKKMGRFGKVSAGYGSDQRYAADAMMSGFNKKMQVSIVGAANNVNKQVSNTEQLMKNSTFKGEGASVDYQPNFRIGGLNKPIAAGVTFQYDFVPDPNWQNSHRFNSDYFLSHNNAFNLHNTITNSFLGKDSLLTNNSASRNSNTITSQRANAKYEKNTPELRMTLSGNATVNDSRSFNESNVQKERTGAGTVSTSDSKSENTRQSKNYNLSLSLQKQEVDYSRTRPRRFTVNYSFGITDNGGSSLNNTKFRSLINPALNRDYSRLYEKQDQLSVNNQLFFEYPGFRQLIFGKKSFANINIGISNNLSMHNYTFTDKVQDYDTTAKQYRLNNYLTNKRDLDIVNTQPSLNLSKSFSKHLSNRFSKNLTFSAKIKGQYYYMQHKATQLVQNFVQEYKRFTPEATVSYNNYQYGRFSSGYSLTFNQLASYPQVNHIAPLIDSSNVFYLPKGNRAIQPQKEQGLSFNFNLNGQKPNNQYYVYASLSAGKTVGFITDSSFYDVSGRRIVYNVNVNGYRYVNATANFGKPFKLNKMNTIQATINARFNMNETPGYINSKLNITGNRSAGSNLEINYSYKDVLSFKVEQQLAFSRSKQRGFSNDVFNSETISTGVSGALQLPKNLTWSTHVMFNRSVANKLQPVKFTLWNANLTYRFLKGNRGEVKFSALDLLRQNKSITNTAGPNYQTFETTNVLQQYYMLTLSYYPRKFGR